MFERARGHSAGALCSRRGAVAGSGVQQRRQARQVVIVEPRRSLIDGIVIDGVVIVGICR
jgi:hypothetical protein